MFQRFSILLYNIVMYIIAAREEVTFYMYDTHMIYDGCGRNSVRRRYGIIMYSGRALYGIISENIFNFVGLAYLSSVNGILYMCTIVV